MSKKVTPQFEAVIRLVDGKHRPVPKDPETLQQYLDMRFKEHQDVYIVVKKRFKKRSQGAIDEASNQNGYYWGVVIPILSEYFGYLPWEMHEVLRPMFWSEPHEKHPEIKRPISSTEVNNVAWENKMQDIRTWAQVDYDVLIPEPNEVDITGDSVKAPW